MGRALARCHGHPRYVWLVAPPASEVRLGPGPARPTLTSCLARPPALPSSLHHVLAGSACTQTMPGVPLSRSCLGALRSPHCDGYAQSPLAMMAEQASLAAPFGSVGATLAPASPSKQGNSYAQHPSPF